MNSRSFNNASSRWDFGDARRRSRGRIDALPVRARAPLRSMLHLSALAATVLLGTASAAADYAVRDVGPWMVSASSDKQGCFLSRTYREPRSTTLLFGLDVDGSNRLTILNANWSIREKERLRLNFQLSNASFPRHLALGIAAAGRKGFAASFGATFPRHFATSEFLRIQRGDVPVEDLGLDGSGAAVAEMRKCVDQHRVSPAPGRRMEEDTGSIPIDPFAMKPRRDSRK